VLIDSCAHQTHNCCRDLQEKLTWLSDKNLLLEEELKQQKARSSEEHAKVARALNEEARMRNESKQAIAELEKVSW